MHIALWVFLFFCIPLCSASFDEGMPKESSTLKYVQTPEDFQRLEQFRVLFNKNSSFLSKPKHSIPKVLHFIWLGQEPFPRQSIKRVEKWMQSHPGWVYKFWTDFDRPPPVTGMKKCLVKEEDVNFLARAYSSSEHVGERAKFLVYEILLKEGGLYIDHDTTPLKSFTRFNEQLDFYCGLESFAPSILSSSVFPSLHLLGARPQHPILMQSVQWLAHHWGAIQSEFASSAAARIAHGPLWALSEGMAGQEEGEDCNLVFPPAYFSLKKGESLSYALHEHEKKWLFSSSIFEKELEKQLKEVLRTSTKILLGVALLSLASFVGSFLFIRYRLLKRKGGLLLVAIFCFQAQMFGSEFQNLMGKGTEHWKYVEKKEDIKTLEELQMLYERNQSFLFSQTGIYKIPKRIHFIWLGPHPFPPQSVENVRMWIGKHPDWEVILWTDRERSLPCSSMKVCFIEELPLLFFRSFYNESKNWGEKSDLLRFEILYQQGGVYVDHDANCLQNFDFLHQGFDFYGGLEMPHPPCAGYQITLGNGVIAARPFHPLIRRVIDIIAKDWRSLGEKYPGTDGYSSTQLVMERTYLALTKAFQNKEMSEETIDIVLPAAYFFAKKPLTPLYSKHFFANAWADFKQESEMYALSFQKRVNKLLKQIKKRSETIQLVGILTLAGHLLLFGMLRLYLLKKRRQKV